MARQQITWHPYHPPLRAHLDEALCDRFPVGTDRPHSFHQRLSRAWMWRHFSQFPSIWSFPVFLLWEATNSLCRDPPGHTVSRASGRIPGSVVQHLTFHRQDWTHKSASHWRPSNLLQRETVSSMRLPETTGNETGSGPFTHPWAVCPTVGVSGRHFGKMHPSPWPMVSLLGIHPEEILSRFQGHIINAVHHRTV